MTSSLVIPLFVLTKTWAVL